MNELEKLKQKLTNMKDKIPLIILGESSNLFEKLYGKEIITLDTLDRLDETKLNVIRIDDNIDKDIIIDIIQSNKYKLIFLCDSSNIDRYLLYMMNYVIKDDTLSHHENLTIQQGLDKMKTLDDDADIKKFYNEVCPSIKYMKRKICRVSSQMKVISLLGGLS